MQLEAQEAAYTRALEARASKLFDDAEYEGPEVNGKKAVSADPVGSKSMWDFKRVVYLTRAEFIKREVEKMRQEHKRPLLSGGPF